MKCLTRFSFLALSSMPLFILSCTGDGNGNHGGECRDLGDLIAARPVGDHYVTIDGSDERDGLSYETAFASIQKGVDALQPGQTLVIGPGEYFGAVFADHLGGMETDTTIRAEIPGTVVLRGDIPAPPFEKLDGYSRVFEADFDQEDDVQMANELDTLKVLSRAPSIDELDFTPGRFYQDREARKLYLSSSDTRAVDLHRYTLSVTPTHGLYLDAPQRVVVEGLTVTGFNNTVGVDYSEQTLWATYGIFIRNGRSSVIRDCQAYLNGRGIGTSNEYDDTSGDNLITGCKAWGNGGVGLAYDTGGIDLLYPRRDQIRDSESFLNTANGISIRGGVENHVEADASFIRNSLSWGNTEYDFWIKAGENFNFYENSVAVGSTGNTDHLRHCVTGDGTVMGNDSIILGEETDLDLAQEFADPDNFDFRLQARSRFVGADAGADRGAFAYEENIFYVDPGGDDSADGLSADQPWQTLDRALQDLEAGDTLYLGPGLYPGGATAELVGSGDEPIVIRGRGREPAVIDGDVSLTDSQHVLFERVHFKAGVTVSDSDAISFHNSVFMGPGTALTAVNTANLRVTHSTFTGFEDAAIHLPCSVGAHLAGNLFDNQAGPALRVFSRETVRYCDHNSYADRQHGWQLGESAVGTLEEIMLGHDRASREIIPRFSDSGGSVTLDNAIDFAGGGPEGHPFGHYRLEVPHEELKLLEGPTLHSVSATTANIEWFTSHPTMTTFSWGASTALENQETLGVNYFGSTSLTGLTPGTTYYFRIDALSVPEGVDVVADPVTVNSEILEFTTLAADEPPATYYVAVSGSNDHAGTSPEAPWRSIQHAANQVNVGDQVIVGEGTYYEKVRLRATGTPAAPITFSTAPGEKVVLDGFEASLNQAFVVSGKSSLRFDGFFFTGHDAEFSHSSSWGPHMGGQFNVYRSSDIRISRVLSDGRTTADRLIVANEVDGLTLSNTVDNNKLEGSYFEDCPNLLMENSVIARPMIFAFILRNDPDQAALLRDNIFTDMLDFKAEQNINLFQIDGSLDGVRMENNIYYVRIFSPEERYLTGTYTAADRPDIFIDPLFADPVFQGVVDLIEAGVDVGEFPPDRLMWEDVPFNFRTFLAANPEVVDLGIGLESSGFDANGIPNG